MNEVFFKFAAVFYMVILIFYVDRDVRSPPREKSDV